PFKHLILGTTAISLLSGFTFTGQEKYVEINSAGGLNGRTSAHFTAAYDNVLTTLPKGTLGKIKSYKEFHSGNHGIEIKILNGPHTNKILWVLHKEQNSSIKLHKDIPQQTGSISRQVSSVSEARSVTTVRPTPASSTPLVDNSDAVSALNKSNQQLSQLGSATCSHCSTNPAAGIESLIREPKSKRQSLARACNSLMNSQGELGSIGQTLFNTMKQPQYINQFTQDKSLQAFCPRFAQLSDAEKLTAWTWFWTGLAFAESSCEVDKIHGTTYKDKSGKTRVLNPRPGYGLWAFERDPNIRKWRGQACSNISSESGQARCAVDTMKRQLNSTKSAKYSKSYWGPVRRGDTQIIPHMRRLKSCY
ncbi:MAG: hypothetical protein AAGB31_15800, partial [Bdellovibrio sp.]